MTLTLNSVSIDASASGQAAVSITASGVTLYLQGSSSLSGGAGSPGIQSAGVLVIDGAGQLTVNGSVGIGCSGNLTINNGTINATGSSGPGISGATITINGGTISASGNEVGIEGSIAVIINGGNVSAFNAAGESDSIRPKLPTETEEPDEQENSIEEKNLDKELDKKVTPTESSYTLQIPSRLTLKDKQATQLPVKLIKSSNSQHKGTFSVELVNGDAKNQQLVLEKNGDRSLLCYFTVGP